MRRSVIAASLLLTTAIPSHAQNLDALRDGLQHLPATLLTQQHGDLAYFVDVGAVFALAEGRPELRPFFRLLTGADINALASLARAEDGWDAKAGTSRDALRYFTAYGRPPNAVSHWGLVDETAASDMMAALESRGFGPAGAPGVIGNGEPRRMDPANRDPSDPWSTMIGAAQFAAANGTNVIQAQDPQGAMLAAAQQPVLGDNPIMQAALDGLERSVGDMWIVQAVVVSPLFGLAGLDPSALLGPITTMDDARKNLEEQMAALGKGIPPYLGGILADVQGERTGVGIALAYPDCTIAQQAADAIALRWAELAGEAAQGDITAHTAGGEDGLCAATVSVLIDTDNPEQNPAYRALLEPLMRGQPGVLQIGES